MLTRRRRPNRLLVAIWPSRFPCSRHINENQLFFWSVSLQAVAPQILKTVLRQGL
jgi:hypothetical protein